MKTELPLCVCACVCELASLCRTKKSAHKSVYLFDSFWLTRHPPAITCCLSAIHCSGGKMRPLKRSPRVQVGDCVFQLYFRLAHVYSIF
uniref:Putative secreted protein n=1 Tax=Rhipicephalus microplus TaxID=6941 RepID=A0A6G5A045_RHIMP